MSVFVPDTAALDALVKFDRPGPRYTSYPTALQFNADVGPAQYRQALAHADAVDAPLALYVHLPFCEERCLFCGCHVIATRKREAAARYLDAVMEELTLLRTQLPHRHRLAQIHLGGGTPTYFDPEQLSRLSLAIRSQFAVGVDTEQTIEVDPRVTTQAHLGVLAALGFSRLSVGVQDFTPEVQAAIGRNQTREQTLSLIEHARAVGFGRGINVDLIYGLPRQTPDAFDRNLDEVIALRPDRLALYSFAFVPWLKGHQKRLPLADIPQPALKLRLYVQAMRRLLEAGYQAIGMDHFALPDDGLAVAAREGRLHRNFMGYTTRAAPDMVAVGVSGIGDLQTALFQNAKKLSTYYGLLDRGELPVERGMMLDDDDELRRFVIGSLMCQFRVDKAVVQQRFGVVFDEVFADALAELQPLADEGLVELRPDAVAVTPRGHLLVRNACMPFDRYLRDSKQHAGRQQVFSRTV